MNGHAVGAGTVQRLWPDLALHDRTVLQWLYEPKFDDYISVSSLILIMPFYCVDVD